MLPRWVPGSVASRKRTVDSSQFCFQGLIREPSSETDVVIIFRKKFMNFSFDFYRLTRFLSVLPFQLLLGL